MMNDYYELLEKILECGEESDDRTGTGTIATFGEHLRFDLTKRFPILTTKEINFKAVLNEVLWMLVEGSVDVTWLEERGHNFWSNWKKIDGTIGFGYGYQFRFADGIDQVRDVLNSLKEEPASRRHIISLWNPVYIPSMSMPCCHGNIIQFNVSRKGVLNCQMYQRSADTFLGLPWNIAFYAIMTKMFAQLSGYIPGELCIAIGDAHIYKNHIDQVHELLSRDPTRYEPPILKINPAVKDIDDFKFEDFELIGYEHWPAISAPVSV
jgi:thymidylate synthase